MKNVKKIRMCKAYSLLSVRELTSYSSCVSTTMSLGHNTHLGTSTSAFYTGKIGVNFPVAFIYDACFPTQRSVLHSLCYLFIFKPLSGWNTNHFSTHRTDLTLRLIVVNIFRIIALRDSNAWPYYVECNVYYYPAALFHNIIICV